MYKSKRSKACDISKAIKDAVWERDGARCILCGSRAAFPNCHFLSRAQGGLGIEENIITACIKCHNAYDNSEHRSAIKIQIREYLMSIYPYWHEKNLIYRKYGGD